MLRFTSANCKVFVHGLPGQGRAVVWFEGTTGGVQIRVRSKTHTLGQVLQLRQDGEQHAARILGRVPATIEDARALCGAGQI